MAARRLSGHRLRGGNATDLGIETAIRATSNVANIVDNLIVAAVAAAAASMARCVTSETSGKVWRRPGVGWDDELLQETENGAE